ncbi:MAG: hypothetical protein MUF43_03645 [Flavobacterium sp.]|jgi:hypothetical protein|nr:hypothetical protein [Flavobacterium sp.]MCU0470234.1 hypothetical protein [Arcicella sp.]
MATVKQYPIHSKYRKNVKVDVNPSVPRPIGLDWLGKPIVGLFTSIDKYCEDGTVENILFQNVGNYVQKQIEILKSNEYFDTPYFWEGLQKKINPREDLSIQDAKEIFLWYDEHLQILKNQIILYSEDIARGGANPVGDILIGVGGTLGATFPVAGAVTLAVGALFKLFESDNSQATVLTKQKLSFCSDLYTYYQPYYEDYKKILIANEREKIVGKKKEEPEPKEEPKSLLGDISATNALLVGGLGIVLLGNKKGKKR